MRIRTLSKNIGKDIFEHRAKFNQYSLDYICLSLISEISSNFRLKLVCINIQWLGFILCRDPALREGITQSLKRQKLHKDQADL